MACDRHPLSHEAGKKDGSWIVEYHHVKMRSVSDSLFNLPVNFQPLEGFDAPALEQSGPHL
jgi:hypothetical protein